MPEDSIMDLVDNEESLYNEKMALLDRWLEQGDAWSKVRAGLKARSLARRFAADLKAMGLIQGRYKIADFEQFADEMLEEFEDYREEAIKAVVERPREVQVPEPMTPADVEFAEKCEALARQIGIDLLRDLVPASPERVRKALETGDKYLNTIPLRKWDEATTAIPGRDLSLSEKVCALKHVAKWHYA